MDNQIYGLTKGQTSPRSAAGFVTKSTPGGAIEPDVKPLELALSTGATFVAQGFSTDIKELTAIIEAGIQHKGFSFINVFSPCVTYNKVNTYDWFKENLTKLSDIEGYDPTNREAAMNTVMQHDGLVTGIIYHDTETSCYQSKADRFDEQALVGQELMMGETKFNELVKEFM